MSLFTLSIGIRRTRPYPVIRMTCPFSVYLFLTAVKPEIDADINLRRSHTSESASQNCILCSFTVVSLEKVTKLHKTQILRSSFTSPVVQNSQLFAV